MGIFCKKISWIFVTPYLISLVNNDAWLKWIWNPSIKNLNVGEDLVDWLTDWLRCSKLINVNVVVIGVLMWMNYALANLNWPTVKVNKIQSVFSIHIWINSAPSAFRKWSKNNTIWKILMYTLLKFRYSEKATKMCPIFH